VNGRLLFQDFLTGNDSTGILGVGSNDAGPTESPFYADGYDGVLVNVPGKVQDVTNENSGIAVDVAPITTVYETVTTDGQTVGSTVSDDIDSGGVNGTIPASLAGDLEPGSVISVYESNGDGGGGTLLYLYVVQSGEVPTVLTGTDTDIDSGVAPFLLEPIYIDYLAGSSTSFDGPFSDYI
jgi:hypothetical protein